ncbi:hypothetical protein AAG570_012639 [Ranatra chinensis]|uniref:Transposase n=1 Tax=Ranatra chinensis TaxID=642074 RepID=A0ABD0YEF7_9HEMI
MLPNYGQTSRAWTNVLRVRRHQKWTEIDNRAIRDWLQREATPHENSQIVMPTPEKSLEMMEADLVFLDGAIRLTLIDRLMRFAYPLQAKTGKRVREGLLLFLTTVDTPRNLVLYRGRSFDNFLVWSLLEEFGVKVHWMTPGHSRSHGMIEGLYVKDDGVGGANTPALEARTSMQSHHETQSTCKVQKAAPVEKASQNNGTKHMPEAGDTQILTSAYSSPASGTTVNTCRHCKCGEGL